MPPASHLVAVRVETLSGHDRHVGRHVTMFVFAIGRNLPLDDIEIAVLVVFARAS